MTGRLSAWPINEVELAGVVVDYLQRYGWDVYQEVQDRRGVADIVARRGPVIWVVETKRTFGLSVLSQAHDWLRFANMVSVAVPRARRSSARSFGEVCARQLGIGVLVVTGPEVKFGCPVKEKVRPRFLRSPATRLRASLCEEQKTYAPAGNATGKRWSPFQRTCENVRLHLSDNGPTPLKELIQAVDHHYKSYNSARGSLSALIERGIVDRVSLVREGKVLTVVLDDPLPPPPSA